MPIDYSPLTSILSSVYAMQYTCRDKLFTLDPRFSLIDPWEPFRRKLSVPMHIDPLVSRYIACATGWMCRDKYHTYPAIRWLCRGLHSAGLESMLYRRLGVILVLLRTAAGGLHLHIVTEAQHRKEYIFFQVWRALSRHWLFVIWCGGSVLRARGLDRRVYLNCPFGRT